MKRPNLTTARQIASSAGGIHGTVTFALCDYVSFLEASNRKLRAQLNDSRDCSEPFPSNLPRSTAEHPV